MKEAAEASQRRAQEIQTFAEKRWEAANKAILEHKKTGEYFKPIDGDEVGNKSLENGWKFVDEAVSQNIFDPKLTDEQREFRHFVNEFAAKELRPMARHTDES